MKQRKPAVVGLAILIGMLLFSGASGANAIPITEELAWEPLTGPTSPPGVWTVGGSTCLSSSGTNEGPIPQCATDLDTPGNGVLRLNSAKTWDSGFAFFNTVFPTDRGLHFSFEQYQWAGTSTGADGIVFFLVDGSSNPTVPGAWGRGLGYADSYEPGADPAHPDQSYFPGLAGGFVGGSASIRTAISRARPRGRTALSAPGAPPAASSFADRSRLTTVM